MSIQSFRSHMRQKARLHCFEGMVRITLDNSLTLTGSKTERQRSDGAVPYVGGGTVSGALLMSSIFVWKKWKKRRHLADLQLRFGWYWDHPSPSSLSAIRRENYYWMRSCLYSSLTACRPFLNAFDGESLSTWLYRLPILFSYNAARLSLRPF